MFDSIIGILLDVKGKAKKGLNSCMYLVNLGIREELHVPLANGKYHLPTYSYNLNPNKKHAKCVCLKTLKVPSGFCSNIRSLLSMKDLTLTNYNSHDCHVMLTTFLPIAIRAITTRIPNCLACQKPSRKELKPSKKWSLATNRQANALKEKLVSLAVLALKDDFLEASCQGNYDQT
jgi:hypothetical protein